MIPGLAALMVHSSSGGGGGGGGGALAVSISPDPATRAFASQTGAPRLCSISVTASASGGSGSYTYQWTRLSGDTRLSAVSPTAATTSIQGTIPASDEAQATFGVVVSDSAGSIVSDDVLVALEVIDTSSNGGINL